MAIECCYKRRHTQRQSPQVHCAYAVAWMLPANAQPCQPCGKLVHARSRAAADCVLWRPHSRHRCPLRLPCSTKARALAHTQCCCPLPPKRRPSSHGHHNLCASCGGGGDGLPWWWMIRHSPFCKHGSVRWGGGFGFRVLGFRIHPLTISDHQLSSRCDWRVCRLRRGQKP